MHVLSNNYTSSLERHLMKECIYYTDGGNIRVIKSKY